jgi:single-strand DNA-binding protein
MSCRVIGIGRLGRDPEMRFLANNTPVVNFSLAFSDKFRGQDGQPREKTCWLDCCMFGKRAEVLNQHVRKGDQLYIIANLEEDEWTDKDGQKRRKHKATIQDFEFVGGKRDTDRQPQQQQAQGGGGDDPSDVPF